MKNALIIILALLFVSCTGTSKSKSASSVNRGDLLYVIDVDNIAKEDSINYSSYFKSIKPIIFETNENCFISNVYTVRVVDEFDVALDECLNLFLEVSEYNKGWNEFTFMRDGGFFYSDENGYSIL